MMRNLEVNLEILLDLVSVSWDYGFADDVFFVGIADITGFVSDDEIEEFASWVTSSEARERGYGQEDYEVIKEVLFGWRNKYCKKVNQEGR